MKNLKGTFDIKDAYWHSFSQGAFSTEKDGIAVEVLGNLLHKDGQDIICLYRTYGTHLTEHLNGSYVLLVHDQAQKCVWIFTDRMTSPVNIYYAVQEGVVHYATSLKVLLASCSISREMNEDAIEEFLVNGYIYGERTLLKNVFKLKSLHALRIDSKGVEQIEVKYPSGQMKASEALERWEETLDGAIASRCRDLEEISQPISSGYDSNYILYVTNKQGKPLHAFSVGGEFGKNEVPLVKENMKAYPNVQLHTALTTAETLQMFSRTSPLKNLVIFWRTTN